MKKNLLMMSIAAALAPCIASAQSLEEKVDRLQKEVDTLKSQVEQPRPAADSTSLFGYGEFNYNRFRDAERTTRADLRRFVLGVGHRFSDALTFNSEVELEHAIASSGDRGEIEMEQAYLNYRFNDAFNVKGGLFLIPLGILNETHEPPTYYGVERNEVETRIIPTTWRELGLGLHGLAGAGVVYDIGVTTGFNSGKLDDPSTGIRSAHQEGSLADAHDLSVYGALNYKAPGVLIGGGVFTGNTGQNGQANPLLKGVAARMTLWDVHAKYVVGRAEFQGLYASGKLGDADKVTAATGVAAPKSFKGWYGQAAYHLYRRGDFDIAPFFRIERYEIRQEEDPANGLLQDPNNFERVRTVGFNVKVHPQVVVKADLQSYNTDKAKSKLNVGLGYMF